MPSRSRDGISILNKSLPYYFWLCITKNYARFSGRARRKEFWGFVLFSLLLIQLAKLLNFNLIAIADSWQISLHYVVRLFFILPMISVGVRRFHDAGSKGIIPVLFGVISNLSLFIYPVLWVYYNHLGTPQSLLENENLKAILGILAICVILLAIYYLIIALQDSEYKTNEYGPNPKKSIQIDEIDQIGKS